MDQNERMLLEFMAVMITFCCCIMSGIIFLQSRKNTSITSENFELKLTASKRGKTIHELSMLISSRNSELKIKGKRIAKLEAENLKLIKKCNPAVSPDAASEIALVRPITQGVDDVLVQTCQRETTETGITISSAEVGELVLGQ